MLVWWRRPRLLFFAILVILAPAIGWLTWFLIREGRAKSDQWASIVFGAIGASSVLAAALWRIWRQQYETHAALGDDRVGAALSGLARSQLEQWTAEQIARRIQDPWPLDVHWLVSPRAEAVMASWSSVRGIRDAKPIPLEGSYDRVADVFAHPDSPRRLVVVGEPGAGKSMLVLHLTLQLLARRDPTDPVPVLLPIAGWLPAQPLDDWIAARLAAGNRALARTVEAPDGSRRSLAREMVANGLILPVLDGLDEMDVTHQCLALERIAAASVGRQFVLTSRTLAYEAAVRASGPLARTAVVELQPLKAVEAAQYLIDGASDPARWAPVTAYLAKNRHTELAKALSTPLTIWLARVVYQHPGSNPQELLTAGWATTRQGIERRLLDRLIPAAYKAAVGGRPACTDRHADRARRALVTLARHLHGQRTYDLAWWQLNELPPGPAAQAALVMLVGLTATISLGLTVAVGITAGEHHTLPALAGTLVGLGVGMGAGFIRLLFRDRRNPSRMAPSGLVGMFFVIGLPVGLPATIIAGPTTGIITSLAAGLTAALTGGASPSAGNAKGASNPILLLTADRVASLLAAFTAGFSALLTLTFVYQELDVIVLVTSTLFTLVAIAAGSWGQFCVTRLMLGMLGRTPIRLIGFLREAHDRGILRQAGGVYQFRHNLLQDHLGTNTTQK